MSDQPAPGGHLIAPLVFFVIASIIAMCLFIGAFVMWLASLIGSIAVAALITAGFFAVLALVIYFLSVRVLCPWRYAWANLAFPFTFSIPGT